MLWNGRDNRVARVDFPFPNRLATATSVIAWIWLMGEPVGPEHQVRFTLTPISFLSRRLEGQAIRCRGLDKTK